VELITKDGGTADWDIGMDKKMPAKEHRKTVGSFPVACEFLSRLPFTCFDLALDWAVGMFLV
jgi:hypothetical protein